MVVDRDSVGKYSQHILSSADRVMLNEVDYITFDVCGVMYTIIENGYSNKCLNPGQDSLHFTSCEKIMNPTILPPAMG